MKKKIPCSPEYWGEPDWPHMIGGVDRGLEIKKYGRGVQHALECVKKAINKSVPAL